jgi:RNA polymerase sigma factor (sigma-70 family)
MTAARRAELRDELIVAHMPLARKIARNVHAMLTAAGQGGYTSPIDLGDVEGWAMVGLTQAAGRYRKKRGNFAGFAYRRIRGAAVDAFKRRAYRDMLHISADALATRCGEDGAHDDAPDFVLGIVHTDRSPLPDELAAESQRLKRLRSAIATLPDDERGILEGALAGEKLVCITAAQGRSATWGRAKLAAARRKVTEAVKGAEAA